MKYIDNGILIPIFFLEGQNTATRPVNISSRICDPVEARTAQANSNVKCICNIDDAIAVIINVNTKRRLLNRIECVNVRWPTARLSGYEMSNILRPMDPLGSSTSAITPANEPIRMPARLGHTT